ncbi:MAG: histone deacetylase family protein [Alphaproteobacteria bacterium]
MTATRVGLYMHGSSLEHDTGPGHPECAARIGSITQALSADCFSSLDRREPPPATRDQLRLIHPDSYIDRLEQSCPDTSPGLVMVDGDTLLSPGTWQAALRSAGAACAAVDAVMSEDLDRAFCALRPPGHHAEPETAMGFCLFSNAAIAARHACAAHGITRVAVMDFDVHHGNGTDAALSAEPDLRLISTHEMPLYPGTGYPHETGTAGTNTNIALPPRCDGQTYKEIFAASVLPALEAAQPELLILSAGFDAHAEDPLASCQLQDDDFGWITDQLVSVAKQHCNGRIVSCLEGGYALEALGRSVALHVRSLMQ